MSDSISPNQNEVRNVLRAVGPTIAVAGLVFTAIGIGSFFSSFGSFQPPRYFWCAFIGLPLLGLGIAISKFAFLGAVARYFAGEVAPVGKDTTNYMMAGTKNSIRDVATAIGEGLRTAGNPLSTSCQKCGAEIDTSANFCDNCGAPQQKSKRCSKCDELNDADARFCENCGSPVT
jgi:hypothetical protein